MSFDPRALVAAVAASGARYAIIGGVAVGLHGNPRTTFDVDVIIPDELEDRRLIVDSLSDQLDDPAVARRWIEAGGNMRLETSMGVLDVLEEDIGELSWDSVESDLVSRVTEDGTTIAVSGLKTLAALKRLADRPVDRADLAALEEIHGKL
ncbi:MAG: hypothetical protein AABM29_05640 [Actinomycetota bacterium]